MLPIVCVFFFFNDTATTEIYTLSLHDALPISSGADCGAGLSCAAITGWSSGVGEASHWYFTTLDRKSTRLNSSHQIISYAVFCLKKKKKKRQKNESIAWSLKQERQRMSENRVN